jgi:hypothetical protein
MEELWKAHTRPAILKGTFAFAVPPDQPLQMVRCAGRRLPPLWHRGGGGGRGQ